MLIMRRGRIQGGSTIHEQLVKLRFGLTSRTFLARLHRGLLALGLNVSESKSAVIIDYLTRVYFGRDFYGLRAAAHGYFGCEIHLLTPAQSFFLVERIALPNLVRTKRICNILSRPAIRNVLGTSHDDIPKIYGLVFGKETERELKAVLEAL